MAANSRYLKSDGRGGVREGRRVFLRIVIQDTQTYLSTVMYNLFCIGVVSWEMMGSCALRLGDRSTLDRGALQTFFCTANGRRSTTTPYE